MTEAFPLATLPQVVRVFVALIRCRRIDDRDVAQRDVVFAGDSLDYSSLPQQNGRGNAFVDELPRRAHNFGLFAFGKDNPLRIAARAIDDTAHDAARPAKSDLELLSIALEIDHLFGDTAGDRGPRYCWRNPEQHAWIERERNQIIRTKLHRAQAVEP